MRRLRFTGTDSKNGGCPALHEDLDSRETVVQGRPLTDPDDTAAASALRCRGIPPSSSRANCSSTGHRRRCTACQR